MSKDPFGRKYKTFDRAFDIIFDELMKLNRKHYHCTWQVRKDGIYHICVEQKKEWKVQV